MNSRSKYASACANNGKHNPDLISIIGLPNTQSSAQTIVTSTYNEPNRSLASLSGLSRTIILAIYQACKISNDSITDRVTITYLSTTVGSNKNCIRTIINRLKAKRLLQVVTYQSGRNGWVIYKLSHDLYLDINKTEILNNTGFGPRVSLVPNNNKCSV